MKNRRIVIGVLALATVLSLGLGYAALSDDLSVDGEANYSLSNALVKFNEDIYFKSFSAAIGSCEDPSQISISIEDVDVDNENDSLSVVIGATAFAVPGQDASFTATIQNDSADEVTITSGSVVYNAGLDAYFKVTCEDPATPIAAGGEGTITVTITMIGTPAADLNNVVFTIPLTATAEH